MKVLVLGGSRFIGLHIARRLVAAGHDVTLLNRGRTNPGAVRGAREIHADRRESLGEAPDHRWDCVVDVSGYVPAEVRVSMDALAGHVPHYLYISSVAAYRPDIAPGSDESAKLWDLPEAEAAASDHAYGALKAACEHVLEAWPGTLTIVRPTYVTGPDDFTDRFTFWVRRAASGGRIAVPPPRTPLQLIDVRDLAAFVATLVHHRTPGAYTAAGPDEPITFDDVIDRTVLLTASHIDRVPVSLDDAEALGGSLPLVVPPAESAMLQVSNARARAAGLHLRSLDDCIIQTLEWDRERGLPPLTAGPDAQAEARLLAALPGRV